MCGSLVIMLNRQNKTPAKSNMLPKGTPSYYYPSSEFLPSGQQTQSFPTMDSGAAFHTLNRTHGYNGGLASVGQMGPHPATARAFCGQSSQYSSIESQSNQFRDSALQKTYLTSRRMMMPTTPIIPTHPGMSEFQRPLPSSMPNDPPICVTLALLIGEVTLQFVEGDVANSLFKSYVSPHRDGLEVLFREVAILLKFPEPPTFHAPHLAVAFNNLRPKLQAMTRPDMIGIGSGIPRILEAQCQGRCGLSVKEAALSIVFNTRLQRPQVEKIAKSDSFVRVNTGQGCDLKETRSPSLNEIILSHSCLRDFQKYPQLKWPAQQLQVAHNQVTSPPNIDENKSVQNLEEEKQQIINPINLDEQTKQEQLDDENHEQDLPEELEGSVLWNLKHSGYYLNESIRNLFPEPLVLKKASEKFFDIKPPTVKEIHSMIISLPNEITIEELSIDTRTILLYILLSNGPDAIPGIKFSESFIRELIMGDWKPKKTSGRPVKDLMFDKIAMGSLKCLMAAGRLPSFDNAIIEQMQKFMMGITNRKDGKSYGWKRKFRQRYFMNIQSSKYYFQHKLSDEYLDDFIENLREALNEKSRYLRRKKDVLYAWLDNLPPQQPPPAQT